MPSSKIKERTIEDSLRSACNICAKTQATGSQINLFLQREKSYHLQSQAQRCSHLNEVGVAHHAASDPCETKGLADQNQS